MRARLGFALLPVLGAVILGACTSSSSSTPPPADAGPDTALPPDDAAPPPEAAPPVDAGGVAADPTPDDISKGGSCPVPTGAGTKHEGILTADETWTAAGSPHHVTFGLDVRAKLTIEPCAVVLVDPGYIITVGSNTDKGSLVAHGTSQMVNGVLDVRPIRFDASDPTKKWGQLTVAPLGTVDLAVVGIQNAGAVSVGEQGAFRVEGVAGGTNFGDVTRSATLDKVLIEKSDSYGMNLNSWGTLTAASRKVWVRGSGSATYPYPLRLEAGIAGTLPKDIVLTGNLKDEILVNSSKTFLRDDTFVNYGVPYHARGAIYVEPGGPNSNARLTIDPGVTVAFEDNVGSGMIIGSSPTATGELVAVGTAASPILFTSASATKAKGDWLSLYFHATTTSGSKISFAKIEYAGAVGGTTGFGCGPSDNNGAIFINGIGTSAAAPTAFVDHTTFENIGGSTVIVSGWIDDTGPNFSGTNTFAASTPACHVSQPKRTGAGDTCDGGRTTCWP
jgi:hypothetical protein